MIPCRRSCPRRHGILATQSPWRVETSQPESTAEEQLPRRTSSTSTSTPANQSSTLEKQQDMSPADSTLVDSDRDLEKGQPQNANLEKKRVYEGNLNLVQFDGLDDPDNPQNF